MQCEINEISSVKKELSFVIPQDQVSLYWGRALQAVRAKAQIKGFRPGKAPENLVEQAYPQAIQEEAFKKLVNKTVFDALDKNEIKPIDSPRIVAQNELKPDQDYTFKATVETFPKVELKAWEGLEIKLPERPEINDEAVDAELENMRLKRASFRTLEERKTVENADFVDLTYVHTCGHEDHDHDHKPMTRLIELGAGYFFPEKPEVEQALIGMEVGASVQIGDLSVTVHAIKECIKPELDDEFAKDVSDEYETLEALKIHTRDALIEDRLKQIKNDKQESTLQALIDNNPFEIPESLVMAEVKVRVGEMFKGIPVEDTYQFLNTQPRLLAGLKQGCERFMKAGFLLAEIKKELSSEQSLEELRELVFERARLS